MTNLTTIELNELKAEELRTLAKEFQMVGSWKAKKTEMVEFLEVKKAEQIEEMKQVEVTEEKPVKTKTARAPKKLQKPVVLLDADLEVVQVFEVRKELFEYCKINHIANVGWIKESLHTGRKMYYSVDGKPTFPKKSSGYIGIGYSVKELD